MKRKRVVVLACVMVIGLTACAGKTEETKPIEPFPAVTESAEQESSDVPVQQETETQKEEKTQEMQDTQESEEDAMEENLAKYRVERDNAMVDYGNGVTGTGGSNPEAYGLSFDTSAINNFDINEITQAFETAKNYVEKTLEVSVETKDTVYTCADPRIWEIYEAEDKGVADGYESENIFICEYCDKGTWQYLILVREGKGSAWEVIHHGSSYIQ